MLWQITLCYKYLLSKQAKTRSFLDAPKIAQVALKVDLILTRRNDLHKVQNTSSYHSVECDTEYFLIISKIAINCWRLHKSKPKSLLKFNTTRIGDQGGQTLLCPVLRLPTVYLWPISIDLCRNKNVFKPNQVCRRKMDISEHKHS